MQNIQFSATQVIQQVLGNGRNLNLVLDETLRNKSAWESSQRAALQDLSYGTLRYYGQLQAILAQLLNKPLADERVRCLLLVALYQLLYSKAASHTVVDQAVSAVRKLNPGMSGLVNAVLRNFLRRRDGLLEQAALSPEGRYSHPQWWIDELREQYGERSSAILEADNSHPPLTLRINRRRTTVDEYLAQLQHAGIVAQRIAPDALKLDKPVPVDRLPGFFEGYASVQDAGAQHAALLLDVRDGMRVLDACAAPGGKTAHMLECAKIDMVALDKDPDRLLRVADNLRRLHFDAQLLVGDASHPEAWWDGRPFQRILADVPCSASGVVRRHPDIKWLRRRGDIDGFATQQAEILQALWPLLAPGGKLLYATCSIFQKENERVVSAFVARQPDARRLPLSLPDNSQGQLLPDDRHDGFFYALLHKVD